MKALYALTFAIAFGIAAQAQTYTESILYNFGKSTTDGRFPYGGLVTENGGYLYGTTSGGGSANFGVVFKLINGKETIVHNFGIGTDGSYPVASLVKDKFNNLYGMTEFGGAFGPGIVFKITAAGKYEILYNFGSVAGDGELPQGSLVLDNDGNLYGTTTQGGTYNANCTNGCGTIFEISPKGVETTLYRFVGGTQDGSTPVANVLLDGKGNLYGTASGFNNNPNETGVVWELTPKRVESILYSQDYFYIGYMARDASGNFYATWIDNGGIPDCCGGLLELSPIDVVSYYTFYGPYDGLCPAPLITGPLSFIESKFYGVMSQGGAYATCNPDGTSLPGGGEVYELDPAIGQPVATYSFPDPPVTTDGFSPTGGVVADANKNLYGTTTFGGLYGYGTVFKLTKN